MRYNDVNENKIVPLQLKISNYSLEELDFNRYTADVILESNDKCIKLWSHKKGLPVTLLTQWKTNFLMS